jgi:hypothetical protein
MTVVVEVVEVVVVVVVVVVASSSITGSWNGKGRIHCYSTTARHFTDRSNSTGRNREQEEENSLLQ